MISSATVTLRRATQDDRHEIYAWLTASDVTPSMLGPPLYPDVAIPTWNEFCADFGPHFFDGSRPDLACSFVIEANGEAVGHMNYDGLDSKQARAELDIWMRSLAWCGRGYGTDAIVALMQHMHADRGVKTFVVRPSSRNQRANRAYEKAGFRASSKSEEEQTRFYGPGDDADAITLERTW